MLYNAYQAFADLTKPARWLAATTAEVGSRLPGWSTGNPWLKHYLAMCEVLADARLTHVRPDYEIKEVIRDGEPVRVAEEIVETLPFGNLLHFAKPDVGTAQPKMLVIAPLSDHFATLLRNTIRTLLRDHDVYVTDWRNARDVPVSEGGFGFDDYVDYVVRFLRVLGPDSHVLAVCQPCVQAMTATALMAEEDDPCQPRTLTLLGGPIDPRISPTKVNALATSRPLEWFENNLIQKVPARFAGAGRAVYPGYLQILGLLGVDPGHHVSQHWKLYRNIVAGHDREAARIRDFYKEYFAVLDITAEFYLETVERVFQRMELAKGEQVYRGERMVDCRAIRRTALLTVEGDRDKVCGVGQTAAAHGLSSSLHPSLRRHHLQAGAGHYGIFLGAKWERQIYPQVRAVVQVMS